MLPGRRDSAPRGRLVLPILGALLLLAVSACSAETREASGVDNQPQQPTSVGGSSSATALTTVDASLSHRIGQGRAIAAASDGGSTVIATSIGVSALIDGALVSMAETPTAPARSVGVSADGDHALVSWADRTELWALSATPTLTDTLPVSRAHSFTTAGRAVLSTAEAIFEIDLATATSSRVDVADGQAFAPAVVQPDGRWWLAPMVGTGDAAAQLWTAEGGVETVSLGLEPGLVVEQAIADPSGDRVLFTLSNPSDRFGSQLLMWDLESRSSAWSVAVEASDNATVGGDGRTHIATGSALRIIDVDGTELTVDEPPFFVVRPIAIRTLGSGQVMVLLADGASSIRDGNGAEVSSSPGSGQPLGSIVPSADRSTMTTVDAGGLVQVLDAAGAVSDEIDHYRSGNITDLALSTDGQLAIARSTGEVSIVGTDAEAGGDAVALFHDEGNVDAVAFSPDGQDVVTGVAQRRGAISFDDTVAVWDRNAGSRLTSIGGESEDVIGCSYFDNVIEYASDGSFVVGGSHDYTINVLDGQTYEILHTFPAHQGPVRAVALSPDNTRLVSTSEDSTIRVWDLGSKELIAEHQTPMGGFWSLAYLPDSSALVATDIGGGLSLFDPEAGETLAQFEGGTARAAALEISPDGNIIAAASGQDDTVLQLWSVASGQVVHELHAHSELVTSAVFDPAGQSLITGASDGTAVVWSIQAG